MFIADPSRFTKNVEAVPTDVTIKPACLVLGAPKAGKSTLAAKIAADTGAIHLKMDDILAAYVDKSSPLYKDRDCVMLDRLQKTLRENGQAV